MTRLEIATQILASYSTRDGVTDGDIRAAYDAADALLSAAEKPGGIPALAVERIRSDREEMRRSDDLAAKVEAAKIAAGRAVMGAAEKPAENPAPDPKPLGTDFAQSFDARDWAAAFVQHVERNPSIATDVDTMLGWFANAIMRGYDERARRAEKPAEVAPVVTGGIQFDPEGHAISPTTGKPTHIDPDGWFGFANKERAGVYVEARGLESARRAVRAMRDAGLAAVRGEAAPVAPALPWVVRWVASKKEIARCDVESDARTLRDLYVTSAVEVAPAAAPTVAAVKFDAQGVAFGDGWEATRSNDRTSVYVTIDIRPGEDAGETVAKMLAACGRMA